MGRLKIIDRARISSSSNGSSLDNLVVAQPCSVDLQLTRFFDRRGEPITSFPFTMEYGQRVMASTGLSISDTTHIYGIDAKSRKARQGLGCLGFVADSSNNLDEQSINLFANGAFELRFALQNFNPNPLIIDGPFFGVQLTAVRYVPSLSEDLPIRIKKEGVDVTEDRKINLGSITAYVVHLGSELRVPKTDSPALSISAEKGSNPIDQYFERRNLSEIQGIQPSFCLSLTDEVVYTNGCPVYMLPFHYLDVAGMNGELAHPLGVSRQVKRMYLGERGMPVTLNAGVLNPTDANRIACENVTAGRNLGRYFDSEKPFALLLPVPYIDGHVYSTTNGAEAESVDTITL